MEYRQILEGIRSKRAERLEEYCALCSKIDMDAVSYESRVKTRQSILALEFAFETDAVNVNQALMQQQALMEEDSFGKKSVEAWTKKIQQTESNAYLNDRYQRASFSRFLQQRCIWPRAIPVKYLPTGETDLGSLKKIPVEDFISALPCETLMNNIDEAKLKKSSKAIYRSYAKGFIGYVRGTQHIRRDVSNEPRGINIHDLASYFNYLESRCTQSDSLKNYRDLIEIRLLFYVPLKTDLLRLITPSCINPTSQRLSCAGNEYRLPASFISLVRSLVPLHEPLLKRNTKQLEKFVSQTSSVIGLNELVTPRLIRRSQNFLAQQLGLVGEKLPNR